MVSASPRRYPITSWGSEAGAAAAGDGLRADPLTLAAAIFEVAFAWLMVFGAMGLFRWLASRESHATRYLSDASYWMYLSHLPLVVLMQWLVVDWRLHFHLKFLRVCCSVTTLVLVSYQWCVRYTFIGRARGRGGEAGLRSETSPSGR